MYVNLYFSYARLQKMCLLCMHCYYHDAACSLCCFICLYVGFVLRARQNAPTSTLFVGKQNMCTFFFFVSTYWKFWACFISLGLHYFFLDVKYHVFNVIWQANYTQSIHPPGCRIYRQYNISSTTSTKVNMCWKWKRNYSIPSGSHWWH